MENPFDELGGKIEALGSKLETDLDSKVDFKLKELDASLLRRLAKTLPGFLNSLADQVEQSTEDQ